MTQVEVRAIASTTGDVRETVDSTKLFDELRVGHPIAVVIASVSRERWTRSRPSVPVIFITTAPTDQPDRSCDQPRTGAPTASRSIPSASNCSPPTATERPSARAVYDGFVFSTDPAGRRPWRPNWVTKRFITYRRRAGLAGFRLHDLRHFMATTMLAAGVPVPVVSERLCHARTSTTVNIYAHAMPGADRDAANLLADILNRGDMGG